MACLLRALALNSEEVWHHVRVSAAALHEGTAGSTKEGEDEPGDGSGVQGFTVEGSVLCLSRSSFTSLGRLQAWD